jgi:hypothetical protein
MHLRRLAAVLLLLAAPLAARAEVERLEILERTPFAAGHAFGAAGSYEKIRARAHIALDPNAPANAAIVDLKLAPRDGRGRVVFASDVLLLRPADPARRNGSLVYDVNNRGGVAILGQINGKSVPSNDPSTLEGAGNQFLFRQGFTLAWSAWTWDVQPPQAGGRPFVLAPPVATENGRPVTGPVAYEIIVDAPAEVADYIGLRGVPYPPAVADDPRATLTERDSVAGPRRIIPRARWSFVRPASGAPSPTQLKLQGGFRTGRIYELVYTAKDPYVVGAGIAGIRDLLSHLKTQPVAEQPPLDRALIFGISQSGRVIQTMLRDGLHVDEAGRPAFDGAFIHVAGGGKGSFNHRFALPTRATNGLEEQGYPTDTFPFTTTPTRDPITGATGSLLDTARRVGPIPKLFFVNTSAEYWNRAASLIHTDPEGQRDAPIDPNARVYLLAGSQHYVGRSKERSPFLNCVNTTNHYPVMRALLLHLDRWTAGTAGPPASAYPTFADRTLTTVPAYSAALPKLADLAPPRENHRPFRLDLGPRFAGQGIVDRVPAGFGATFETRVPAPDADGTDLSGVRLPELTVPLGTRTGWNRRDPSTGFAENTGHFDGSFVPFARTEAERAARRDPRPSIAARYPGGRADYLARVRTAAEQTVAAGFLLPEELESEVAEEAGLYDRVLAHDPADRSCAYILP